ncbi:MAG: ABC transporter permease, partial [Actinobacteria bacterium]|nr:ABC transporter permease [Actinomycetota bacterium]
MVMAEGAAPPVVAEVRPATGSTRASRAGSGWGRRILTLVAIAAYVWLFLPILNIVVFSFNDPAGKYNLSWDGFTLANWADPFKDAQLTEAFW